MTPPEPKKGKPLQDPIVPACTGTDAVNFFDLKAQRFDPRRRLAYHYAVFGHYHTCDSPDTCSACVPIGSFGNVGIAETPGNDFIVSLGAFVNFGFEPGIEHEGGILMHELGHNFGLRHGGNTDGPDGKPNYLSPINANFGLQGIPVATTPGSIVPLTCPSDTHCPEGAICAESSGTCTRIDYSQEALPSLDE